MEDKSFDGIHIFSATKFKEREVLGETITRWMKEHSSYKIVDTVVRQSSDASFHCLSVAIFYKE
ncbi:MAG: hypothetical protein JRG91_04175 [Deltaproteobacteria bacterium]|nr:hypothetical protein [Deltaproteobacteria bacterium]